MFKKMYNNVLKIFPTINLPLSPIPHSINTTYYLYTGDDLDGGCIKISNNEYVIRDKNADDFKFIQCIIEDIIVDVYIVPYDITDYFDNELRISIIYKIFTHMCANYTMKSEPLISSVVYAPIVLTLFVSLELGYYIEDDMVKNILEKCSGITFTDEMISSIRASDIEILLCYGGVYNIIKGDISND